MGLFDSSYEARDMALDTMSEGVSKGGMEELVKLIKILGEDEFDQKVLVREDHITYFVD